MKYIILIRDSPDEEYHQAVRALNIEARDWALWLLRENGFPDAVCIETGDAVR